MESAIATKWDGAERRKSPRNKDEEKLKNLTRQILYEFFNGNPKPYYDHLAPDAVFLCNGSKMLISSAAIRDYMNMYDGHGSRVLDAELFCRTATDEFAYVYGIVRIGDYIANVNATIRFTLLFRISDQGPLVIHQQSSFDFFAGEGPSKQHLDTNTITFVKKIIASRKSDRTSFQSGGESIWLGFDEVLYIQGAGKHTRVVCMDKVIACDTSIGKLILSLPKRFVQVHRSYIVNTKHIAAIRRFEVELASGTTIPIPESRYPQVRRNLLDMSYSSS